MSKIRTVENSQAKGSTPYAGNLQLTGEVMVRFAVDPEELSTTAAAVESIRAEAGSFLETCSADAGNADLAAAISEILSQVASTWQSQTSELDEISNRLRTTADLYRRADLDSAPRGDGTLP